MFFYLIDFFVCQFDVFIMKLMGLDKYFELWDMIFGNYEKLVYQVQIEDFVLKVKVVECVEWLGLEFEYCFIGYGDLKLVLKVLNQ